MSVKGFKLSDGTVEKYDYSSLEDIVTDDTLALSGVAADAKKVGDELSDIKSDLGNLSNLETTAKNNLVAAINEAAQSGGGGGGGGGADPYNNNPAALGTASPGSSTRYSRGDHVHPMPSASDVGALPSSTVIPSTAADVGAIPAPSSPSTGAFLVWNGSAWVAQTLSTWQGGSF